MYNILYLNICRCFFSLYAEALNRAPSSWNTACWTMPPDEDWVASEHPMENGPWMDDLPILIKNMF